MEARPLSVISYPKKGIRHIRISGYTLIRIDLDVFKDESYSLYRSGFDKLLIDNDKDLSLICSFLSIDLKEAYINYLIIDYGMCSFI